MWGKSTQTKSLSCIVNPRLKKVNQEYKCRQIFFGLSRDEDEKEMKREISKVGYLWLLDNHKMVPIFKFYIDLCCPVHSH